jgi:hypothetical protein
MEHLISHRTHFDENWYLSFLFRKSVEKMQVSLKSDKWKGTLHENASTFMTVSRWILLVMINVSNKSCRDIQNTHFVFSNFLCLRKSCRLWRKCRKLWCSQRGRRWQYGGALHNGLVRLHTRKHTPAPLQPRPLSHPLTQTHTHTHTELFNTYCFSTATAVAWTRLVMLCVHGMSCYQRN